MLLLCQAYERRLRLPLAAHDDHDSRHGYHHMKKHRQNLMPVLVALTAIELLLGLMLKRLIFGEKLTFGLAVDFRLPFELVRLWATVCRCDGIKIRPDAFRPVKVSIAGCLVLQKPRRVLIA
jgi:hypothetical protein